MFYRIKWYQSCSILGAFDFETLIHKFFPNSSNFYSIHSIKLCISIRFIESDHSFDQIHFNTFNFVHFRVNS
ncbi:hypothetical protein HanIR_Chr01g0006581 [Helianthus annuus]|nr:hypothetical protein HanIR_Chr01g0006581 [Helianthus annuus]